MQRDRLNFFLLEFKAYIDSNQIFDFDQYHFICSTARQNDASEVLSDCSLTKKKFEEWPCNFGDFSNRSNLWDTG